MTNVKVGQIWSYKSYLGPIGVRCVKVRQFGSRMVAFLEPIKKGATFTHLSWWYYIDGVMSSELTLIEDVP